MTAGPHRRFAPRRADAPTRARHRLLRTYRAELAFEEGAIGRLHLSEAVPRCVVEPGGLAVRDGLSVSTRFGHVVWFDYEALLLACSGIDIESATTPSARIAFVRYAVAALPPSLRAALGDPVVEAAPERTPPNGWIVANLSYEAAPIRLAMRLAIDADRLPAMLEDGPWHPEPATPPAWLTALPSRLRVVAGELAMPPDALARLRCGDVIRLPASAFDAAGCGQIRIFDRLAQVRWLDDQHCFEVQRMSTDHNPSTPDPDAEPPLPAACVDTTQLPVRLSFSLGTLSLALGDVAAIRSGTLLRLQGGLPPSVRIEANGLPLGYGELVDLDGRLAVEVTEWPHPAAEPQAPST